MRQPLGVRIGALWGLVGCSFVVQVDDECRTAADCPEPRAVCLQRLCVQNRPVRRIRGNLSGNRRWTSEQDYLLEDTVYVQDGVLTIEEGTRIFGAQPQAALIVQPEAVLVVNGSADAPVVFTSIQPPGERKPGDWGGIALLGDDFINAPDGTDSLEGIISDERTRYGGDATGQTRDCGTLRYLRIEFAGFRLFANEELNGLTLAGCGPETLVDFVQVHRGADDGIELFGGRAILRHALITQPADDGLDWDQGWRGVAQFIIVQQTPSDRSGIEADNSEDEPSALPRSAPRIYNLTVVAENADQTQSVGATLRRGTAGELVNAMFIGHRGGSLQVIGRASQACALATDGEGVCPQVDGSTGLDLRSVLFANGGADGTSPFPRAFDFPGAVDSEPGFALQEWATRPARRARVMGPEGLLLAPFDPSRPNFAPDPSGPLGTDAELLELAETPPNQEQLDRTANFLGAIRSEAEDWTQGWTAFPDD